MSENSTPGKALTRREFLRASIAATGAACLAGMLGCTRQQDTPTAGPADTARKGFTRPTASPWFTHLNNARVRCELCPRHCKLSDGQRAVCKVRVNRTGKLYTLAYGNPALIQEDPVERKPFFHVLPGTRALSIATAGCNLSCKSCEVWDMAQVAPEELHAYDMLPERVVAHARAANVRSISYAFGEPVVFYEYMSEIASLAKEAGLMNLMHTAGYIQPQPLKQLCTKLDAANVDLKGFDPAFYREVVGGELRTVLETLIILRDVGVHIEVTNLVIPTLNDDMGKIRDMCKWIVDHLGTGVPVHFARFYPLYKLSDLPRTPVATLDRARETARNAGLEFVYIARVTGHDAENTFCPVCGRAVIRRVGFVVTEIHLAGGGCKYCGARIPGRWE